MIRQCLHGLVAILLAANLVPVAPSALLANNKRQSAANDASAFRTTTPIKHLVIIFQENESFDHYFGTYPKATNPQGEPRFEAKPDTPSVNGLIEGLIDNNHNHDEKNSVYKPIRLDRSQNYTCR